MGVNHLEELRSYLKEHSDEKFSKSKLRLVLKQNHNTIEQNILYLLNVEKSIKFIHEISNNKTFYQWRNKQ